MASVTQGAGYVPIWAALLIGLLASPIAYFFIAVVKKRFGYDDALDVWGCHGIGGVWGGIATGLFAMKGFNPDPKSDAVRWNGLFFGETELFTRQLIALAVTVSLSIIGTLIALGVAKLITKELRVTAKDESRGLDLTEHGELAYPAFNGMD